MHPRCREAVTAAAGKPLTEKQLQAVEDSISAAMRRLAREREDWSSLTTEQRMTEGAALAMQDIKDAAARKLENAERQILKVAETNGRIEALQESFKDTPHHDGTRAEAYKRDLYNLAHRNAAERKIAMSEMRDLIQAVGDKSGAGIGRKFLMAAFDTQNPAMTRDVVREIFKNADGHTGNEVAKAAARAWLDTIEGLRTRFNGAGGDVGKLDYGYVPQPHDTAKIRKAGVDAWVDQTMPLLDRSRYLKDDGARMSDAELHDFLKGSYETLRTEGLNKTEPGQFHGTGARANRGSESRQLHFADGDAWHTYNEAFGKTAIYPAMQAHIGGMVRDIGLVETYGPDGAANHRLQMDLLAKADGTSVQKPVGTMSINPQTYFDMVTGKTGAPVDETLANVGASIRAFQAAKKLGGAIISSINDLGTVALTTGYNRLPYWRLVQDIGSQASKETRDWMTDHGMIAESVASHLSRFSGDNLGTNWASHAASSVMKVQLLNAWTDGLRQGFTMTMNAGLARMAKSEWSALTEFDRVRLTRSGITEGDWKVLNTVTADSFKGRELLTPQAILRSGHEDANSIAAKVFGFIHDESEMAVVNPDMAARAVTTLGLQAGTKGGEVARTVTQFKSFPVAMITRHWNRMLEGDLGTADAPMLANRMVYGMALATSMLALGAVSTQAKQLLAGKDPIDMTKGRFWAKAFAQGGALSIVGDLLLVDPQSSSTDTATTAIKNLAGPTVGDVADLGLKLVSENIWQAAEGKDTHWEAELLNWAKSQIPGNTVWWVKPLLEHGITNELNESLSPGYLSKQAQKAAKDWGQRYFWRPQDTMPQRAPDLAKAIGN